MTNNMTPNIIITADDFGISENSNHAIFTCANFGILTNTCIMANGEAFAHAVALLKKHPHFIPVGVHLNIIEGKSLITNTSSLLTDHNGRYKLTFLQLLLKSTNQKFLAAIEREFRAQIETVLAAGIKPDYLNSHVHTHAIPAIFAIVCRLAKEYQIPKIRTQCELPYFAAPFIRHLTGKYFINIIKNILLNFFTLKNKRTLQKYQLISTDYFIGVLYTGNMDRNTIIAGIKRLPPNCTCEIILHPTLDQQKIANYREYLTLLDPELKKALHAND